MDSKYKDDFPRNTILKIKNILLDLNIVTVEKNWKNSARGFYSVSVGIQGTDLSTNGKGTSPEYALASAYGELMERLQNQSFFRLAMDLNPNTLKYKGFYYAPDEKYFSKEELINNNEWIKNQIESGKKYSDADELLDKWIKFSYEEVPKDFAALPYINLTNDEISYIPIKMISKMYMTNGMCAGNTKEEALVQGLSEIFERMVNKEIVMKRITPPDIPRSYLENYPRIYSMIKEIEKRGNYKIVVKDCSLGKNYPVVGVLFIDLDNQSYFIKFGSHPIFEIALERTLTELLQGQELKRMMGTVEFSFNYNMVDEYENLLNIFTTGSGYYPTELFGTEFNYDFTEFKDLSGLKNKAILIYMINLLNKNGYDVFIRDVSFLGFPSFHVIVPGLSEIDKFYDEKSIDDYIKYNRTKKAIRNVDDLSEEELKETLEYIGKQCKNTFGSVHQLINLPTKDILPWYYENIQLFMVAGYYKIGDFYNAYKWLNKYLQHTNINPNNKELYVYYKCVRDYIGTRMMKINNNESVNMLLNFYNINMIKKVIYQFGNNKDIFMHFGKIRCWNCEKCQLKDRCTYDMVENIYKKLKNIYANNVIEQKDLQNLFVS